MGNYSAADLVQLPRLAANGAMALGEQMIAAAKPHKKQLPKGISKALTSLSTTHGTLTDAIRDQVSPAAADSTNKVVADRDLDGCWSGTNDFLTGFTKLPEGTPEAVEAAEIKSLLLPDGLKFILLPYELEWAESATRIKRMTAHKLDVRIKALGGGVFIDALTKAHNAYGLALGMTAPLADAPPPPPSLREALDRFSAALRSYVVKVSGSVDDDEPETQALADKLLAPLALWDVGPVAKGGGGSTGGDKGEPEGTPGKPGAPSEPTP